MCIGGIGLTKGYWNNAELTHRSFPLSPFEEPGSPNKNIYRTGDRVKWRKDGELLYLGRLDHQAKVNGVRIELGEVEAVLGQLSELKQACVMLGREGRLVAFIISRVLNPPTRAQLRAFLRRNLPESMIPRSFVFVQTFPLLPNGKVDGQQLLNLSSGDTTTDSFYTPPSSQIECALVEVWQAVLEKPQIGIHDNFFELGGDSILAVQMVASAQHRGIEISVANIFEYQEIYALAKLATEFSGNFHPAAVQEQAFDFIEEVDKARLIQATTNRVTET